MHKIGDMLNLHIDGGSDQGVGVFTRLEGVESKLGGRRSLHIINIV